jgi:hypothetical protein
MQREDSMSKEFPFKCARCGFCCLNTTCPIGQSVFKVNKEDQCPGLYFNQDMQAGCRLAESETMKPIIGIGNGCDMLGRAIQGDKQVPFAPLPEEVKHIIVCLQITGSLQVLSKEKAKALYGK